MESTSEEFFPEVRRRDMLFHICLSCDDGSYTEFQPRYDIVRCPRCGHTIPRWLTKAEVIKILT